MSFTVVAQARIKHSLRGKTRPETTCDGRDARLRTSVEIVEVSLQTKWQRMRPSLGDT